MELKIKCLLVFLVLSFSLVADEKYVVIKGERTRKFLFNGKITYPVKKYQTFPFKVDLGVYPKEALIAFFKFDTGCQEGYRKEVIISVFDSLKKLKEKMAYPSRDFNHRVSKPKLRRFLKEYMKNAEE